MVELMVALALSAILVIGVITVYLDSNRSSRLSASLARIQEAGRIAADIVTREVRMAGFQGCADPATIAMNIIADNPPTLDFGLTTIRGWEVEDATWADGTEFDGTTIEANAVVGSDVLAIQRGNTVPISVTGNMHATNANIQVAGELSLFEQNDVVLISDCENADLFRISSNPESGTWAHAENVNEGNRLSQLYDTSARIMSFTSTVYFVADTGRDDINGNPVFALYRQSDNLANSAASTFTIEELVEGVESLQLLFGERLATDNIRYVTADTAGLDMSNVVAVKLGLLVSDAERVQDNADQFDYILPGQTIEPASAAGATVTHPEDFRLRRTFETAINLRNRN